MSRIANVSTDKNLNIIIIIIKMYKIFYNLRQHRNRPFNGEMLFGMTCRNRIEKVKKSLKYLVLKVISIDPPYRYNT